MNNIHLILSILVLITLFHVPNYLGYADELEQPTQQKIGNYETLFTTDPISPLVGTETQITILMRPINGEFLQNKSGTMNLIDTNSFLIDERKFTIQPAEHKYNFTFEKPGKYILILQIDEYKLNKSMPEFRYEFEVSESNPVIYPSYDYIFFGIGLLVWLILVYILIIKKNKSNRIFKS